MNMTVLEAEGTGFLLLSKARVFSSVETEFGTVVFSVDLVLLLQRTRNYNHHTFGVLFTCNEKHTR